MKIKSQTFKYSEAIPERYTCDGENVNPEIEIISVPENTKSLVLIFDDPDAPGGVFTHWLVWNINPNTEIVKKDSVPDGAVVGKNSAGENAYMGPCPPTGTHAYLFKLYAVDVLLPHDQNLTKKEVRKMIEGHIIEKTLLRGFYERNHSENF